MSTLCFVRLYNVLLISFQYSHSSYSAPVWEQCIAISLSTFVSVCQRAYLWNRWTFLVQIPCGCGSVLLWRRCNTLCTSGFMDDITFGHSELYDASGIVTLGWSLISVYALLVACNVLHNKLSFVLELVVNTKITSRFYEQFQFL